MMTNLDDSRAWFITGASRGFGRLYTSTALAKGDRVVATARTPDVLSDLSEQHRERLIVLPLDVVDRAAVFAAVDQAIAAFGRIDVVVNNAGYGLTGAVEEISETAARQIMDTNFFGMLWVCQAVAPHLRAQRGGRIVQMSSIAGLTGFPTQGLYAASKFAVEGMSESLASELESFGVRVTLVEPGVFATGFTGPSLKFAEFIDAYQPVRDALMEAYQTAVFGDPMSVVQAVMAVVDSQNPPRRLLIGGEFEMVVDLYRRRLDEWQEWEKKLGAVANAGNIADGDDAGERSASLR